jgi:hypothetical protein
LNFSPGSTSMRRVNRPDRQRAHLLEKISLKQSISLKKPGKRTKRWKKWADKYKPAETAQA